MTPSHASQPNQANGLGGPAGGATYGAQWSNNQSGVPSGHYANSYNAPVVTRYPAPSVSGPPYQQYPGPVPQTQGYPPTQQGPYQPQQNQQYGPSGAPYGYNQSPQQAYSHTPHDPQYGQQVYQSQPYDQYPHQNEFPNPGNQGGYQYSPQPYYPPASGPLYQQPHPPYPPQSGPYAPPQWNNTQPALYNATDVQQPNNSYGQQYKAAFRRNPSWPRKQFNAQQSPQLEYGSEGAHASPQTPASGSNSAQYPSTPAPKGTLAHGLYATSTGGEHESINESKTSISGARWLGHNSFPSDSHKGQTTEIAKPSGSAEKRLPTQANEDSKQIEEGEVEEDDPADEEFKWEWEKIFKESQPTENVVLAQPLSTTFDMTPAPLIQMSSPPSVSRYARKDNLKEFIRPIRSQPQWTYLQEDPAFSDTMSENELIPLHEVSKWMAKRQGIDPEFLSTRKREMPCESLHNWNSAGDADQRTENIDEDAQYQQQEDEHFDQEHFDQDMRDSSSVQAPGTPISAQSTPAATGTPTLDRAGTPSLSAENDVWAPQPGEGSLSQSVSQDTTEALLASLGVTGSPKPVRKRSVPHLSISADEISSRKRQKTMSSPDISGYNVPQQEVHPHGHNNHGMMNSQPSLQNGQPPYNGSRQKHGTYENRQYGTPRQSSYGNGMSPENTSPYNSAQYSSVSPHSQFPNGSQYLNTPHGTQHHDPYGNPQQGIGPPQSQDPWSAHHQSPPHTLQQHEKGQGGSTGYTTPQQGPYRNGISPAGYGSHDSPTQNTSPHARPSYIPFNSAQGAQSSCRNSGNADTGSHRKGSSTMQRQLSHGQADGDDDIPSPPVKTPVLSECQNSKTSDSNEPDESPLTPTSAEILGKLTQAARKNSSDRKADDMPRRLRRPQPVVAEAYR